MRSVILPGFVWNRWGSADIACFVQWSDDKCIRGCGAKFRRSTSSWARVLYLDKNPEAIPAVIQQKAKHEKCAKLFPEIMARDTATKCAVCSTHIGKNNQKKKCAENLEPSCFRAYGASGDWVCNKCYASARRTAVGKNCSDNDPARTATATATEQPEEPRADMIVNVNGVLVDMTQLGGCAPARW